MLVVRCKDCNTEITGHEIQAKSSGCPNMMTVKGDSVSAVDLGMVVVISSDKSPKKEGVLSPQDLSFQEERRKRKVRKLDFEIR